MPPFLVLLIPGLAPPCAVLPCGMQGITPLRRSQARKSSQSYALSAIRCRGRFRGRPCRRGTRTCSIVATASLISARFASERTRPSGIPSPSVTMPPFRGDEASVQERPRPLDLPFFVQGSEQGLPDPLPDPLVPPPAQPPPRRDVRPVLPRHILPPAAGAQHVQDPLDDLAVIYPRTADARLRR